ncbi:MAG: hypothetical protein A2729_01805 [Candidatus Buchananbacteria bacterium RIFCSPHIGHO2_01_FULL_39_14]|uniref:Small-conductance mechanosensitive ion channel n=2 Tax=Candidatus Buchananiibacteriota TaxID=1817903 RepID=A0A1G1YNY8_9BACT|nr:MAG: hypothetical protein A2729_01805 [Candidatus Buchananbacteria bacterium RIFCSPHIGHO2_01_FULL_39_14]OGY49721.1 MAG: hypothetical protein A3D39_04345 [Candidatus Buchananbacteria bacterium RIFCSPHIGHO2_02_FULL_39_17]OGY54072.1 MAG: hypothetical protein A2912_01730 [Candidatus Buchananbacteria bacterium RIFCSPLOWO2_01_FULL_40_23b]
MTNLNDWGAILTATLSEIWFKVIDLVPNVLGAIIVFIIGLFIADGLGRLVAALLKKAYLDRAVETTGLKKILEKIGFKMEISKTLGLLITWFLYAVVLVGAADILGLTQISEFLMQVVLYIPSVIIAVVILIVGIIVSNFVQTLVVETAGAAKLAAVDFLANVAKWAILIFTFMAALIQLKVATELIQILFTGLVLMFALAGGIAFGLGGKERAKEMIDRILKK